MLLLYLKHTHYIFKTYKIDINFIFPVKAYHFFIAAKKFIQRQFVSTTSTCTSIDLIMKVLGFFYITYLFYYIWDSMSII